MTILGIAGVHPITPSGIPAHDDSVIPGYQALSDAVHEHGMLLMQQLWHGGAARPNALGGQPWSASAVPNPNVGVVPVAMTKGMIDEVVESFAAAARRVHLGGLDGVEVHGAHGYLVHNFLSAASNHREDEYGGSIENRARFLVEVLTAIRAAVGEGFPVGVRITSQEFLPGGLVPEETAQIARIVEPLIDFLDVSCGGVYRPHMINAPMDEPLDYELPYSKVVTDSVHVPTIVAGRIMTLDQAEHILASGVADMVSIVRSLIADPHLVVKSAGGHDDAVRPCIGSSQGCVGGSLSGSFHCVVNPAAGRESTFPQEPPDRVDTPRHVMVVGGGPAGLECARTAALRGHRVSLYEMRRELGGQVRIAAAAPMRGDYAAITAWLADEVARLGVDVHLATPVDPDLVFSEMPDAVVVATGSAPTSRGFRVMRPLAPVPGAELRHVWSSWDVLGFGGRATLGESVVLYDDAGTYEPLSVADAIVQGGHALTFVTRFDGLGANVAARANIATPVLERLARAEMRLVTGAQLIRIDPGHVELERAGRSSSIEADSVVIVGINEPSRELADYLDGFPNDVHLIGDANGGRTLAEAIRAGAELGRAL